MGISYDAGKLEVLLPGLHIRKSPTFRFREFVSVQEQVRHLEPLKVNTNDGIAILVNAIITYRVEDPVRAYRVLFFNCTRPPSQLVNNNCCVRCVRCVRCAVCAACAVART